MARFVCTGKNAASAATIDLAQLQIWNPSTSKRIKVLQIHFSKITAGAADEPVIRRSTARGATPATTTTPTSVMEYEQIAAPPSSFVCEFGAFGTQPTFAAGHLHGFIVPAAVGSGLMWVFDDNGIEIPAASGLCVVTGIALAFPASRWTIIVED
jgi:hypothetical protein